MLQKTGIYHAEISGEISHQADSNTNSQMWNSDQSSSESRLRFTDTYNNKQSISKDILQTHFSVETSMVLFFQSLALKHFCHFLEEELNSCGFLPGSIVRDWTELAGQPHPSQRDYVHS